MLGLLNREKIDATLNCDLPLILVVTILDQNLTRVLLDDGISYNILYTDAFEQLVLQKPIMNRYCDGDLLAFNDSISHLYRKIDLTMSLGEGVRERNITLNFFLILCVS